MKSTWRALIGVGRREFQVKLIFLHAALCAACGANDSLHPAILKFRDSSELLCKNKMRADTRFKKSFQTEHKKSLFLDWVCRNFSSYFLTKIFWISFPNILHHILLNAVKICNHGVYGNFIFHRNLNFFLKIQKSSFYASALYYYYANDMDDTDIEHAGWVGVGLPVRLM